MLLETAMSTITTARFVRAASLAELDAAAEGRLVVQVAGHTLVLLRHDGGVRALDNRCPHLGFPLHRGSVKDGILTCHWHHARFDVCTGGAFDLWADDARAYPVEERDGDLWVDVTVPGDPREHLIDRLQHGLERNLSLVLAKTAVASGDLGVPPVEPFRAGVVFGARYRRGGWGQGLTIHTCLMNLVSHLDLEDRPRALYQGLSAVAGDTAGNAPRFAVAPLPGGGVDPSTLKRWFRRFVLVRDAEGAERCLISAIHADANRQTLADMLFTAATDHHYYGGGHVADFTNKALEALDLAGWTHAEAVLPSLAPFFASAGRSEENNAWRNPVDLVAMLRGAFEKLPDALAAGRMKRYGGGAELIPTLLAESASDAVGAMLAALSEGCKPEELAALVTHAAATRVAQFHTSNEFGDWDTALHTFTFANAIEQGMHRAPSTELLRGVFDAAMSVHLDRFLNIPPARLPAPDGKGSPEELLEGLMPLLDGQQQVNPAGELAAAYLAAGGDPARLMARLGRALLREDRDFHTIQCVEAAVRQYTARRGTPEGAVALIAAARYLAAHAPTRRTQDQLFRTAERLHRGERLFEG
jgi:nitrite reductase/ring-hydroxylating ferredoxin subunit